MEISPVVVIENRAEFSKLIDSLQHAAHIAVDTESNSFYAYYNRICLIQVSTENQDYIIDPLAFDDISDLGTILADPAVEKIFHAAPNDVAGLKRDFKFCVRNIFDTAIAAKILGYQQLGLARILNEHFGVCLNKKWQRHDWGKRPLRPEQLDYARLDTHYLIALRHRLAAELQEKQLLDAAKEAFEKVCTQEIHEKNFRASDFLHICGAKSLDVEGKRVLKALYLFREHEARRRDRAPFRILTNETLLRLALQRPKSIQDFSKIKGIPRTYNNSRTAVLLLEVIRKNAGHGEDAAIQH
ncbi:MAG: ribonuclease D [Desulfobacteraceae bacterium]|nr:ribonuclease D [Desulfobacteraceae bacterium]